MNIAVEGNLGCKKKILIKFMCKKFKNIECLQHKDISMTSFLRNPHKWAFPMGVNFLLDRQKKENLNVNVISNKSDLTLIPFINSCLENEYINKTLFQILQNLKETLSFPKYDYIIYVKSDPDECYRNLIERGISGIDYSYLQSLHFEYENLFKQLDNVIMVNSKHLTDIFDNELRKDEMFNYLNIKIPFLKKNDETIEWTLVRRKNKKK